VPSLGPLGAVEILIIVIVAALVLGPRRLPGAARSVGRSLRGARDTRDQIRGGLSLTAPARDKSGEPEPQPQAAPPAPPQQPPRSDTPR
jgi:Sec-independent protein translocase protein TatA